MHDRSEHAISTITRGYLLKWIGGSCAEGILELLERLHDAQGHFYAGGSAEDLPGLLTGDVCWTVPGTSAIAGTYEGFEQVLEYFTRRRDQASKTFEMHTKDVLTGDGTHAAALTDGTATIGGQREHWSTVGLYRFRGDQVSACWLLPLDPEQFDRIWSLSDDPRSGPSEVSA